MNILITGAAGFIGFHLTNRLLDEGHNVIGLDSLNDYYDARLKNDRLTVLQNRDGFKFRELKLEDKDILFEVMKIYSPAIVINLAAQAGVRYSIENPKAYIDSNIYGFLNVLEACREFPVKHLLYASSSSVYGANTRMPFSVHDPVNHQVSLYGATKKSNELMAHTYSHLFGVPTTGMRFFTVYGPWGRPDMAYFSFTKNIIEGKSIKVFNHGHMKRDFTYIDDIVDGIQYLINEPPKYNSAWDREHPDPASSFAPYRIVNLGNHQPVELMKFINILELYIGEKAKIEYLPMQPGDVHETYADITEMQEQFKFSPSTSIEDGLGRFVSWYKGYYGVEELSK